MSELANEIRSAFQSESLTAEPLVNKCVVICQEHGLTAEELRDRWEAYSMNRSGISISEASLTSLAHDVAASSNSRPLVSSRTMNVKSHNPTTTKNMKKEAMDDLFDNTDTFGLDITNNSTPAINPITPLSSNNAKRGGSFMSPLEAPTPSKVPKREDIISPSSFQSPAPSAVGGYANRSNPGKVEQTCNPNLRPASACPRPDPRDGPSESDMEAMSTAERAAVAAAVTNYPTPAPRSRCRITQLAGHVNKQYRYMFTPVEERASALERQLLSMQDAFMRSHGNVIKVLSPVGLPSQDDVWVCARVCCEAAQGRMNKTAVMIEGSREQSGGARCSLDLDSLADFALFPGQIIVVKGVNATGKRMTAKQIIQGVSRPKPRTPRGLLRAYNTAPRYLSGAPLHIMAACGPFTTADSFSYQPLEDLMAVARATCPDVLILMGPFVDAAQPLVQSGAVTLTDVETDEEVPVSFDILFQAKVSALIEQLTLDQSDLPRRTRIVMLPSLRDAQHDFVYPQPAFQAAPLGLPSSDHVVRVPNPATFRLNEVTIGATSMDTIFHLSAEEISKGSSKPTGGRLGRLFSHMLQQRSFYPLFPAPAGQHAQLDLRHARRLALADTPDILIAPSRLNYLAQVVNSTVCINPGSLAKGTGGGTFASITVHPLTKQQLEVPVQASGGSSEMAEPTDDDLMYHNVAARCRVDIMRI